MFGAPYCVAHTTSCLLQIFELDDLTRRVKVCETVGWSIQIGDQSNVRRYFCGCLPCRSRHRFYFTWDFVVIWRRLSAASAPWKEWQEPYLRAQLRSSVGPEADRDVLQAHSYSRSRGRVSDLVACFSCRSVPLWLILVWKCLFPFPLNPHPNPKWVLFYLSRSPCRF